ncbi:MAG: FAD-dependent monooxygenase [Chitinophagaceae bacterium]
MEKLKKSVLISGASIAGLTMAYWLNYYGYKVTVVEIGLKPRRGGAPIDVRGEALDCAHRMGVLDAIKKAKLPTEGLKFMNAENGVEGIMLVDEICALSPGEDIELRREELVDILYQNAREGINYIFDTRIIALEQDDEKVNITLRDGTTAFYDYVIGADGIHSGVRKMVFGEEDQFAFFLNFYFAVFTVDPGLGEKNFALLYNTPNTMATIHLYNKNFADAVLAFRTPNPASQVCRDIALEKQLFLNAFEGIGWKVPQLLESLKNSEDFYLDQGYQIKMPSWTKGRVALIGDAAYAPGFATGMGSTLAIQGATLLADEMAKNGDYNNAFRAYNEILRPIVEQLQAIAYPNLSLMLPETEEKIIERNKAGR